MWFFFCALLLTAPLAPIYEQVLSNIDEIYASRFCFEASDDSVALIGDEKIVCRYGAIGYTPTLTTPFDNARRRCCFLRPIREGVVWAIGESIMTRVIDIPKLPSELVPKNPRLFFEQAALQDVLVVDARSGLPVPNVNIVVADSPIHLVSLERQTDEDGYAVIPMLATQPLSISLRANGYLPQKDISLKLHGDATNPEEIVVELDPGIQMAGVVRSPTGDPIAGATIHATIRQKTSHLWHSDLDNPLPITSFTEKGQTKIIPQRASYTTNERGKFLVTPLPRGKMTIYATHPDYAPSAPIKLDTRDGADLPAIELSLQQPKSAYVRVEDDSSQAVAASIYVFDATTGAEIATVRTPSSGAIRIHTLPNLVKFYVFADGYIPTTRNLTVADNDEIILPLRPSQFASYSLRLVDPRRNPIDNVALLPANTEDRSDYPECQTKSGRDGSAILQNCPQKFLVEAFHPDYAKTELELAASTHPASLVREIQLHSGLSFDLPCIEAQTERKIKTVECEVSVLKTHDLNETNLKSKSSQSHATQIEIIKTDTGTLHFFHRPSALHKLTCNRSGENPVSFSIDPTSPPDKLVFPQKYTAQIILCDAYGSPVAYGHIQTPSKTYETDEKGHAAIAVYEGEDIAFRHYLHGISRETHETIARRIVNANGRPLEIRLPDVADSATIACARRLGIDTITDGAQIRVDDPGAYRQKALLRGDSVESCNDEKIVVIRDDRVVEISIEP